MGLEDLAMFRSLLNSVVLYPADAVSTEKLVEEAARHYGIVYLRTSRNSTPVIYDNGEEFPIGGSKILKKSNTDVLTVASAGICLHEALAAYESLKKDGISIRVIDLYSIKPLDIPALEKAADQTRAILTVEDHFAEGGIGEAVASALARQKVSVYSLAVQKMPKSGKPAELLDYEQISKDAIILKVKELAGAR
jgi:transketolase